MSVDMNILRQLAKHAARGEKPTGATEFSNEDVQEAFLNELRKLGTSVNDFRRNKYDFFALIIENAEEIVPAKVESALGAFAEIKNVRQNEKAVFKTKLGSNRAKQFITQVGLSGVYQTFRLDSKTFSVHPYAVGGAVTVDYERILDGAETLAEVMQVITDGLISGVFMEVQKALINAMDHVAPSANRVKHNGFDPKEMFKLASTVKAYGAGSMGIGRGSGAIIFAPPQFIYEMGIDNMKDVTGGTGINPSDGQINEIVQNGYISIFRGIPVMEIPQSFVDEKNEAFTVRPDLAYVLPTGGEKIVKVVFEGETQVKDFENKDNSMEIQIWRKMGVGIQTFHNWGIYQNTSLSAEYKDLVDERLPQPTA